MPRTGPRVQALVEYVRYPRLQDDPRVE
jgi:hypothetical protein